MSKAMSVVGKRVPRVNGWERVTGRARFVEDIELPRMLYGTILRSPYPHARILRVDATRAESLSGVEAVVTSKDVPSTRFSSAAFWVLLPPGVIPDDQRIIDEEVCFVGDTIAAVVAQDEEIAEHALEMIRVDYEKLPAVFDPEEALKPDAPLVHRSMGSNLVRYFPISIGDVEKGFAEADHIVEEIFRTQRQKQCQMEPIGCIAAFSEGGELTLWSPTQNPHVVRRQLARIFGMPSNRVNIISPSIGGSFGVRLGMSCEPICAAMARKVPNRPVRLIYSREEEFIASESRHAATLKVKIGAKKDGTITALQFKSILDTGAYATHGPNVVVVMGGNLISGIYKIPNKKYDGHVIYTNNPVSGAMRGYGGTQGLYALESTIDMMADKLGIDPINFRLKNVVHKGDPYPQQPMYTINTCGLEECIKLGAEKIGWSNRHVSLGGENMVKRGIGMSSVMWVSAPPFEVDYAGAFVKINEDGSIHLITGATDQGTGAYTGLVQIAAEELGVFPEDVKLVVGNTDATPFDVGSHANRTTYVSGEAIRRACQNAKQRLLQMAAKKMDVEPEALEIKDRMIRVKGVEGRELSIADVASFSHYNRREQILGEAVYAPANAPPFTVCFVEVEVDIETGQVKVSRLVTAHDIGRIINPDATEAQLEGGAAQGIGYALTEGLILDQGKVINPSFIDYKIFGAADMPTLETILVETFEPSGPFNAKAVGEPGFVVVAPAVANAIYNALGVRIRDLPITPEKVLEALKGKRQSSNGLDVC